MWRGKQDGFSLVELVLSIGIFSILIGVTIPVYRTFQVHNDLTLAAGALAGTLRRAQIETRGGSQDGPWGVRVDTGAVTLFQGADYASRDTDFDEVLVLGDTITPSGVLEVVFSGIGAAPSTTGSILLTGADGSTETVTIGSYGEVGY